MSTHGHTTIRNPTGGSPPTLAMDRGHRFILAVTLLAGLFMTAAAVAALLTPNWFADTAGFPHHTHFVHDVGAVHLGLGGHPWDAWGLAAVLLLTAIALVVRLDQVSWVVGEVTQRWPGWCAKRPCW